jgi:hypothetical protein
MYPSLTENRSVTVFPVFSLLPPRPLSSCRKDAIAHEKLILAEYNGGIMELERGGILREDARGATTWGERV